MAISGLQTVNVGIQNESANSDSLYTAFNKIKTNFAILANDASQYDTFTGNTGISVSANATAGSVDILNTGVTSIVAGTGVTIDQATGAVTISAGGSNSSGVTSVGVKSVSSQRIAVSGSPIVSSGNILLDLAASGTPTGVFTYPTVTVDTYGRITNISNGNSVGTVTSVGVTPGTGIQVSGSPITSSGSITITNTGVTSLSAGSGIAVSGSNGNVTISSTLTSGTVTSVGVSSSTLTVTGSPVVSAGTITVNLPNTISLTGNITGGNLLSNGIAILNGSEDLANGAAANVSITATYFSTAAAETGTLAAGTAGQIKTFMMYADTGDMVITVTNAGWKTSGTGTITFNDIGDGCTLQYVNNKWFCIGQNGVTFG